MAYEFKKLKDVTAVEAITDKANILIEENGVIKKVNKSQVAGKQEFSWNDLKDKPFDVKTEIIEVMPETTIIGQSIDESGLYGAEFQQPIDLKAGSMYTVKINDTIYRTMGVIHDVGYYFGNASLANLGADTGEPFLYLQQQLGWDSTLGETITISIDEVKETITPIDSRFIDSYDLIITCQCSPSDIISDDNTLITGGSIDNVMAAFDEGRPPRVKIVYYTAPESYSATAAEITSVYVNKYYDEGAIEFLIYNGYNILGRSIGIGPQGLHSFGNKAVEIQSQK